MDSKEPKDGMGWMIIPVIVALFLAALAIISYVGLTIVASSDGNAFNFADSNTLGTMGDFFGGILNPALAFCSLILLVYTLQQNRVALSQGRDALLKTRESLDQGKDAIEQSKKAVEQSERTIKQNAEELELTREELKRSADTMEEQLKQNKIQQLNSQFYSLYEYIETELRNDAAFGGESVASYLRTKTAYLKELRELKSVDGDTIETRSGRVFNEWQYEEKLKFEDTKYLENIGSLLGKIIVLVDFVECEMKPSCNTQVAKTLIGFLFSLELRFSFELFKKYYDMTPTAEAALIKYGVLEPINSETKESQLEPI